MSVLTAKRGGGVIPTMILFGLVFGRWWRTALAVSAFTWPVLLVADGVVATVDGVVSAAVLSLLNAGLGVAVHQGLLRLSQARPRASSVRDRPGPPGVTRA